MKTCPTCLYNFKRLDMHLRHGCRVRKQQAPLFEHIARLENRIAVLEEWNQVFTRLFREACNDAKALLEESEPEEPEVTDTHLEEILQHEGERYKVESNNEEKRFCFSVTDLRQSDSLFNELNRAELNYKDVHIVDENRVDFVSSEPAYKIMSAMWYVPQGHVMVDSLWTDVI